MSYVNAKDVLLEKLVKEIQKYIDGQLIYIPRKSENSLLCVKRMAQKKNWQNAIK